MARPLARSSRCRQKTGWHRTACELFEHWADYRVGRISRFALARWMGPVRRRMERLVLRGRESGNKDVRGTCQEWYEHRGWLWTFLHHEGIEPTNNAGERSLRHAVIWRSFSFGTQDAGGSRFVETMLTIIETCRQQHRSVLKLRHRCRPSPPRPSVNSLIGPRMANDYQRAGTAVNLRGDDIRSSRVAMMDWAPVAENSRNRSVRLSCFLRLAVDRGAVEARQGE